MPAGEPVDVFVPIPQDDAAQQLLKWEIDQPHMTGGLAAEPAYGNRFWHGHLDKSDGRPLEISLSATVRRKVVKGPLGAPDTQAYSKEELEKLGRFLKADARVPLEGGPLDGIDKELGLKLGDKQADKQAVARAIYDYVVDNMEYKKVGTGWGNGDTFWACSAKYGNCTDFHALFLSLARRRGIPSKFEMGFPIPDDKPSGQIGGYHCWVNFDLPGRGWVPIDASEARKHPESRELLFGTQPADRVKLSEGRDLQLGEGHRDGPLNYFVYPYVEVSGKKFAQVAWRLDYAEGETAPAKIPLPAKAL